MTLLNIRTMLREEDLLAPLAASIRDDTDSWPQFILRNAKVIAQETEVPVSLLAAHGEFLVRVEGTLEEVDAENGHLVRKSSYRSKTIVISDVATYSFSLFDDDSFGFWAAGKAGWFEITKPVWEFREIFEEMKEATGMFYYLADKYRNSRGSLSRATAKIRDTHVAQVFNDYLQSNFCTRYDAEDAREGFYHHREFLMKSMLEGQEGLEWDVSPILRQFKRIFPEDFKVIKEVVEAAQTASHGQVSGTAGDRKITSKPEVTLKTKKDNVNTERTTSLRTQSNISAAAEDDEHVDEESPVGKNKRKSRLRPKSTRASKKFMSRQAQASLIQDRSDETEDVEDSVDGESTPLTPILPSPIVRNDTNSLHKAYAHKKKEILGATVSENPLPSYYEPKGPGDTWTCPYDGCFYQIWDGRAPASVEMIKVHFADTHAGSAEDLINRESRPWVSVDHLLERIKGIAGLDPNGISKKPGFPESVVRRY